MTLPDIAEPVSIDGRGQDAPQLHRIPSHTKVPANLANNIYIYLEDTESDKMASKYESSRQRALPSGRESDLRVAGMCPAMNLASVIDFSARIWHRWSGGLFHQSRHVG